MNTKRSFVILLVLTLHATQTNPIPSLKEMTNSVFDRAVTCYFGNQEGSSFYQATAHEFLKHFGVRHPERIAIRSIQLTESLQNSYWRLEPGFAWVSGLWFNEDLLDSLSENERLWYIAHECAHYALRHPLKILGITEALNTMVTLDTICAVAAGIYLSKKLSKYSWYKQWPKLCFAGISTLIGYIGGRMLLSETSSLHRCQITYRKKIEQETDIAAAAMLCNHRGCYIVESHLETVKNLIEKGYFVINGIDHPSFDEQRAYLEDFLESWNSYKALANEMGADEECL